MSRRSTRDAGGNGGRGGNWIRKAKRLRIYARDSWRCVWCGIGVVRVAGDVSSGSLQLAPGTATLDHVIPRGHPDSSNAHHNLVTACASCNAARGDRGPLEWCATLARTMGGMGAAQRLEDLAEALARELPAAP